MNSLIIEILNFMKQFLENKFKLDQINLNNYYLEFLILTYF